MFPLLHLEIHGRKTGIVLKSGELVCWKELKDTFLLINQASKVNFVVVLATCYGAEILFTLNIIEQVPVYCYVAPIKEVMTQDIEYGYKAFYNELFTSRNLDKAVQKLNETFTEEREKRYILLDPDSLVLTAFEKVLKEVWNAKLRQKETERLLTKYHPFSNSSLRFDRKRIKTILQKSPYPEFKRYRERFLMLDLFPENNGRFKVNETKLRRLVTKYCSKK